MIFLKLGSLVEIEQDEMLEKIENQKVASIKKKHHRHETCTFLSKKVFLNLSENVPERNLSLLTESIFLSSTFFPKRKTPNFFLKYISSSTSILRNIPEKFLLMFQYK